VYLSLGCDVKRVVHVYVYLWKQLRRIAKHDRVVRAAFVSTGGGVQSYMIIQHSIDNKRSLKHCISKWGTLCIDFWSSTKRAEAPVRNKLAAVGALVVAPRPLLGQRYYRTVEVAEG